VTQIFFFPLKKCQLDLFEIHLYIFFTLKDNQIPNQKIYHNKKFRALQYIKLKKQLEQDPTMQSALIYKCSLNDKQYSTQVILMIDLDKIGLS
jgi:hypothetical protein